MLTSDLVLEGGGVKGAGLAGAVHVLSGHYGAGDRSPGLLAAV